MIGPTALARAGNRISERDIHVDPVLRRIAALTAELVSRRLEITTPRVRWLSSSRLDVRGETLPADLTEVWVKPQPPADTVETVAHESRHCWQLSDFRWARPGLQTSEDRERDAAEYGRQIRAELTRSTP